MHEDNEPKIGIRRSGCNLGGTCSNRFGRVNDGGARKLLDMAAQFKVVGGRVDADDGHGDRNTDMCGARNSCRERQRGGAGEGERGG